MPTRNEVAHDPILTNVSVKYRNEDFIADKILPSIKVPKESFYYYQFGKENFDPKNAYRRPKDLPSDIDFSLTRTAGSCEEYSLRILISDRERDDQDKGLELEIEASEITAEQIKLAREIKAASLLLNTSNITNYQQLAAYNEQSNPTYVQFDDYENSDPVKIISALKETALEACGRMPNTIVMNPKIEEVIANNPQYRETYKYTQSLIDGNFLPMTFLGMKLLRGAALKNTATLGASTSLSFVWGNYILLAYVEPSPGKKKVSVGYTFERQPLQTRINYDKERKGTWTENSHICGEKIVAADCAYLITSVLSA